MDKKINSGKAEEVELGYLNVEIKRETINNAKIRALTLGLDLKDYVERIISIDLEKSKIHMSGEQTTIICPNPKCRAYIVVNKNEDVADCPLCGKEITSSEMQEVPEE